MRVVFDTNVLISGTLWQGTPHRCLRAGELGAVSWLCADEILEEYAGTLRDRFGLDRSEVDGLVVRLRASATLVLLTGRHGWVPADPDDDKFVEAALVGGADAIVSGDRHLRDLGTVEGIPIWTPRQMLDRLPSR